MIDQRYIKNIDEILTEDIQKILLTKNIAVIGCGGQGGYILEFLARLGVHSISFWDGDSYEKSNLNRQIGCTEKTIGSNKVEILFERLNEINSNIFYYPHNWYFGTKDNDIDELIKNDFIFMAADCYYNIKELCFFLEKAIMKGIPVINCPVQLLGGYIFINTKNNLEHFHNFLQQCLYQSSLKEDLKCNQSAYKCALIGAEAINQMILYFSNSRYACLNTELAIDIYHHKYILSDQYCKNI